MQQLFYRRYPIVFKKAKQCGFLPNSQLPTDEDIANAILDELQVFRTSDEVRLGDISIFFTFWIFSILLSCCILPCFGTTKKINLVIKVLFFSGLSWCMEYCNNDSKLFADI